MGSTNVYRYFRWSVGIKPIGALLLTVFAIGASFAQEIYGTAFSIGDGYTYVTNHHVVDGAKMICVKSASGELHRATLVNVDRADDLVLLRTSYHSNPLRLGTHQDIIKGMNIITIGFPFPDVMGLESKVTEGIINSLSIPGP